MMDALKRNQWSRAGALEEKNTALQKKNNAARKSIDDLKKKVKEADWPESIRTETLSILSDYWDKCGGF